MASDQTMALGFVFPKNWLVIAPHSPLAAKFPRLQSGTKLPLRGSPGPNVASFHDRVAAFTEVLIGFNSCGTSTFVFATYRPADTLSAVRPSPQRSYEPPSRGFKSFQLGMSSTRAKLRGPIHLFANVGACCTPG